MPLAKMGSNAQVANDRSQENTCRFSRCSTAAAIAWDESFKKMADPSGRAVLNVHTHAYEAAHE